MDENSIDTVEVALLHAQLHFKSAFRRIEENKVIHAIGTMYDVVEYFLKSELLKSNDPLVISSIDNLMDLGVELGISEELLHLTNLQNSMVLILNNCESEIDADNLMITATKLLKSLKFLLFDLANLPPEDPQIY